MVNPTEDFMVTVWTARRLRLGKTVYSIEEEFACNDLERNVTEPQGRPTPTTVYYTSHCVTVGNMTEDTVGQYNMKV